MSDDPTSRLLGEEGSQSAPTNTRRSRSPSKSVRSDESTPLLARDASESYHDDTEENDAGLIRTASPTSFQDEGTHRKKSQWRWPSIIALAGLSLLVVAILGLGFAAPEAIEEYVNQAAVFEPTNLSIDSFTAEGLKARIQGNLFLDGARVEKKPVRDLGRAGTWIARAVETSRTTVNFYLPEYGNLALGTAEIPSLVVFIRDGEVNHIDLIADIIPGEVEGLRQIASDWVEGRLGQLRIQGKANVRLKSGIFNFGTHTIMKTLMFDSSDIPAIPKYNITRLNVHELELADGVKAVSADVSITAYNEHPVSFTIPPLAFDILVPGCLPEAPYIRLANATTNEIHIESKQTVQVDAQGIIRQLSEPLLAVCPGSTASPLDTLLGEYIHGKKTTLFVKGADTASADTPAWITQLISSFVVSVPFSGRSMDKLIRKFSMDDVHFGLPNPLADPNTPEAQPKISATVKVTANLPDEMNIPINVSRVRSRADVLYEGEKFGVLDLRKWQKATSKHIDAHDDVSEGLLVEAVIKDAPLNVTDSEVFAKVIEQVFFGGNATLSVQASVDIEVATVLGTFAIRDIPAEGEVPLKPLPVHDGFHGLFPKIGGLEIIETSESTILLEAKANFTNPTNYSATVPYVNINILSNGTILGKATATNITCGGGRNENLPFRVLWNPLGNSGRPGALQAREFMSQYISGHNTTLTLKTHNETFPSIPLLGSVLSKFPVEIGTPRLSTPKNPKNPGNGDGDDENVGKPHFIEDATMHLLTSTATFTLLSPLERTTLFLTHINATAYYNHTDPVGVIIYDFPIAVTPGVTTTPPLPVDWSLEGVGYDAVKEALGGTLKLGAKADVGIRVGNWIERIWFEGEGIGAHVKI